MSCSMYVETGSDHPGYIFSGLTRFKNIWGLTVQLEYFDRSVLGFSVITHWGSINTA